MANRSCLAARINSIRVRVCGTQTPCPCWAGKYGFNAPHSNSPAPATVLRCNRKKDTKYCHNWRATVCVASSSRKDSEVKCRIFCCVTRYWQPAPETHSVRQSHTSPVPVNTSSISFFIQPAVELNSRVPDVTRSRPGESVSS